MTAAADEVPLDPEKEKIFCTGMSAAGAHIMVDGIERPALLFNFQRVDGEKQPVFVLVLDDPRMAKVGRIVSQAAQSAIASGRRARRGR